MLIVLLTARALSPADYSLYALVLTLVLMAIQFLNSWQSQALLHFFPTRTLGANGSVAGYARMCLVTACVGGILVACLLTAFGYSGLTCVLGAMLFSAQTAWSFLCTLFQALENPKEQLRATVLQSLSQVALAVTLYLVGYLFLESALLAVLFGFIVGVGYIGRAAFHHGAINANMLLAQSWSAKSEFRRAVSYGAPISVWILCSQLYSVSDRFVLESQGLLVDLGKYAATRELLVGVVSLLAMPLLLMAHPIIMRLFISEGRPQEAERLIEENLSKLFLLGAMMVGVTYSSGQWALSQLLPRTYLLDGRACALIAAALLVGACSMYAHKGWEVSGNTWRMALLGFCVAVISLSVNIVLAPIYGLTGVLWVGLLSQVVYFMGAVFMTRNILRVRASPKVIMQAVLLGGFLAAVPSLLKQYASHHLMWPSLVALILQLAICALICFKLGLHRQSAEIPHGKRISNHD